MVDDWKSLDSHHHDTHSTQHTWAKWTGWRGARVVVAAVGCCSCFVGCDLTTAVLEVGFDVALDLYAAVLLAPVGVVTSV